MTGTVDVDRVQAAAAALDNPVRLRMLQALLGGSAYPGELSETLRVSPQQMTKHIAALQRGGLVDAVSEGRRVRLAVAGPEVSRVLELLSGLHATSRPSRCPGTVQGARQ